MALKRATILAAAAGTLVGCLLLHVHGWPLWAAGTVYGVALVVWAQGRISPPPRITHGRRGGDTVGG